VGSLYYEVRGIVIRNRKYGIQIGNRKNGVYRKETQECYVEHGTGTGTTGMNWD